MVDEVVMAELKSAPKTLEQRLMEILFGEDRANQYLDYGAKERLGRLAELSRQQQTFSNSGNRLTAEIPGANPEASTGLDALTGALLSMGGMPSPISRSGVGVSTSPARKHAFWRQGPGETSQPLGMPKEGASKGYATERYRYELPVRVTWKDGMTHTDVIKGLNRQHAMERARANWPDAYFIEPINISQVEDQRGMK